MWQTPPRLQYFCGGENTRIGWAIAALVATVIVGLGWTMFDRTHAASASFSQNCVIDPEFNAPDLL